MMYSFRHATNLYEGTHLGMRKRISYLNPLSRHQIRYNERVKVPNLGVCRNNPKYQVKKSYWGRYESDSYLYYGHFHTKMGPILLGKFYVSIDKKVFKLPVLLRFLLYKILDQNQIVLSE